MEVEVEGCTSVHRAPPPCLARRNATFVVFYCTVAHGFHEDAVSAESRNP